MVKITESKMIFGPYTKDDVFEIEKSKINMLVKTYQLWNLCLCEMSQRFCL